MRILLTAALACAFAINASAAEEPSALLTIRGGGFEPGQLSLPAGVRVRLVVRNQDPMPAEFESYDLSREVIVPGNREVAIYVGPLEAGSYRYFNDFNRQMQGDIVAKSDPAKGK